MIRECVTLALANSADPDEMPHYGEYSAILLTFIKLPSVIKILFCLFLSGRFTLVLLYYSLTLCILVRSSYS